MRRLLTGSCAIMLLFTAACSSKSDASSPTTTNGSGPSTTIDPNLIPNKIPYVVGAHIGLPNDWIVTVTKVTRPYSSARLPALAAGQQYVAVDITMENDGETTHAVTAADIFKLADGNSELHDVVEEPGSANGIDGPYPQGTTQSGTIVFAVPPGVRLALALDGPKIGTQRAFFTIDPPTVPED